MQLNLLRVDTKDSENGKWFSYPHAQGVEFKICRSNSAISRKVTTDFFNEKTMARGSTLSDEDSKELGLRVSVSCVRDWRGLIDESTGEKVPHSDELCREILANPEYENLLAFVTECALNIENFRAEALTREKKPSKRGQRGKRSTAGTKRT